MKKLSVEPSVLSIRQWQDEREKIRLEQEEKKPQSPLDFALQIANNPNLAEKKKLLMDLGDKLKGVELQQTMSLIRQFDDTFRHN